MMRRMGDYVSERFVLRNDTVGMLEKMEPEFGYGEFGEFIFYRTYSRKTHDGRQESWADCVRRVVEGTLSIRKDWYTKNRIEWNERKWQEYAYGMAMSLFEMKWLPPGRGLWAMGTDFIYERGSMALYNCAYTEVLYSHFGEDIEWIMDSLMHGVGVGFGPVREAFKLKEPIGTNTYVIEDTRESWCAATRALVSAYKDGSKLPVFDYSLIRPAGTPIKGFGGIASGPAPLIKLHNRIVNYCDRYIVDNSYDSVMLKTDIVNSIGNCVVAGNVRRSAELALAPISDPVFLDLKDYNKYPYRADIGWMSNNSVTLREDSDFEKLGLIADRVKLNGEPGILNLRNFPEGRIGKRDDVKQDAGTGLNPCITRDTKVLVADGRGFVAIKDLVGSDTAVYCIDSEDKLTVKTMRNPRITGYNQKILKITFDTGDSIRVTENHKFVLRDRSIKMAKDLKFNDALAVVNRYTPISCEGESYWDKYIGLGYSGDTYAEHVLIASHFYGLLTTDHVHHSNGNRLDNTPTNLEPLDSTYHLSEHAIGLQNGNSCGLTNAELEHIGIELCKKLGRRFSYKEWQTTGPIKQFSQYRKNELGSITEFAFNCAKKAGVLNEDLDPRTLRQYILMSDSGYDVKIVEGRVHVKKECEICGAEFYVNQNSREQGACDLVCGSKLASKIKASSKYREAATERKQNLFF